MFELLKEMQVVGDDEKAEHNFYSRSGYNRRINQLTCGITQKELLATVHESYKAYIKKASEPLYKDFRTLVDTFSTLFIQRANQVD